MSDYNELIKQLRNRRMCIQGLGTLNDYPLLGEAADAIEELSKPRWIPVSEKLPESGAPILICGDGNVVEQGFFCDEYGYWYDCRGNRTFVHHWMPLPEPPKEG